MFDIGHSEDTYFIVMEYVDGVDLKALLDWRRRIGRRIPIAPRLYIIMEICKGLAYAHELPNPETGAPLGIVHRDISPPNVLISKQGEVKVVDFGLAKATSQVEITDPGVVKGKMSYLSPEAARGEEVDARADIFAVGILLYEMLTGKRLFYGETDYQTVELVRNAKIPPIKPQNPQVEPELEDIVRKALAKRKEDRYQNATDLQDALAQYSYSRGLKVIARDIAELVRAVPGGPAHAVGRGQAEDQHHRPPAAGRDRQVHLGRLRGAGRGRAAAVGRPAGAAARITGRSRRPRRRRLHRSPGLGRGAADARARASPRSTRMEARKTSRDMAPPVAPPQQQQRRAGAQRVPTPATVRRRPIRWIRRRARRRWRRCSSRRPAPRRLPPEALSATLEPPPDPLGGGPRLHPPRRRAATSSSARRSASSCWARSSCSPERMRRARRRPRHSRPRRRNPLGIAVSLEDEGEIGAGGTATVRRMYDPSLRRRVAMKTLSPDLAGNARAHRDFVQEAEITAQLEHPNIIPIHELAMVDGRASFSMRLIRGQNLQQTMATWSALPDQADALYRVLNVFLRVCDAVAFAHSRGVIHGDIKPANVMVGSFGEVYLVDWGVASLIPTSCEEPVTVSAERHTRSGVRGTPAFMAPEQAKGVLPAIGERTDVFGLGALLYFILTGFPPFAGSSASDSLTRARTGFHRSRAEPSAARTRRRCAGSCARRWRPRPRIVTRPSSSCRRRCAASSTSACTSRRASFPPAR